MADRTCLDCGKGISLQSKSGCCRGCSLQRTIADPEVNARRIANMVKACQNPIAKARRSYRSKEAIRKRIATDPAFLERKREEGRKLAQSRAGMVNRPPGHESRVRAGRSISERKMAWCPVEWRPFYHNLIRSKGLRRAQAMERVWQEMERVKQEARRKEAEKSPFERQMEALMRGAQLVEKQHIPSRSYQVTLAGGSPL